MSKTHLRNPSPRDVFERRMRHQFGLNDTLARLLFDLRNSGGK